MESDPKRVNTARESYEHAAAAGNTKAMVNLGLLLADQMDPPELGAARHWYEKAARAGDADGWYGLGAVFARLGDRAGVEYAWRNLLDSTDVDPDTAASAALGLAALAALDGLPSMAMPLLQLATMCGSDLAARCGSSLTPDLANRRVALERLAEHRVETPALNFLGLAAYEAGVTSEAIAYWRQADISGDAVASLLLHLTVGASGRWPPDR